MGNQGATFSDVKDAINRAISDNGDGTFSILSDDEGTRPASSIGNGQQTVTTAGTRVALGASTQIRGVVIKALSGNTGNIYVGNSSVDSSNGFPLEAKAVVSIATTNLSNIYIDSDANAEGVAYLYVV